jgi:hypothetical protein
LTFSTEHITDDFMRERLAQSKTYTVMLLKQGPNWDEPDRDAIIWEHGRRNFALRADGVLAIVVPITDESQWCGLGIFDASADEVARIMDDDPGVRAGIFEYEIHPGRAFPGDQLPA